MDQYWVIFDQIEDTPNSSRT